MIHEREDYNKRVQCIDGSIPEDEPVFLLRGKDTTAREVIRFWAFLNQHGAPKVACDEKIKAVMAHADRMREYARERLDDTDCTC